MTQQVLKNYINFKRTLAPRLIKQFHLAVLISGIPARGWTVSSLQWGRGIGMDKS